MNHKLLLQSIFQECLLEFGAAVVPPVVLSRVSKHWGQRVAIGRCRRLVMVVGIFADEIASGSIIYLLIVHGFESVRYMILM